MQLKPIILIVIGEPTKGEIMTSNINCLSKYYSMSHNDQAAVRWGIWVLEGMQEELGFSERIISTNPSCPSIEKAIKLFETNGKNVTPPQVKEDVQKMKSGIGKL